MKKRAATLALFLAFAPDLGWSQEPLGAEFRVNSYTTNSQDRPVVAVDAAGNFVIVWDSTGRDGNASGVAGQLYDPSGARLATEFQVNSSTTGSQRAPSVAAIAGGFVVVWVSPDPSSTGIFGQRFDASGTALGQEFLVNGYTTGAQGRPVVAPDVHGGFVVVWDAGTPGDGNDSGVFARRFDAGATPVGPDFLVNSYTTGLQWMPAIASAPDGRLVVTWSSAGQDGASGGIYAQRFAGADLIFEDGFE